MSELPVTPDLEATPDARPRRGVALLTALFGIVVIALMISGAFFTSTQEYRGGRNQLVEQRAFAVAEFGLNSEIANWDRSRNLPGVMAVGATDSSRVYVAQGDTARVNITRLTPTAYWVTSEGRASIGNRALESKRETSAYVRIAYPSITPKAAITTAGDITVKGSADISGFNTNPPGWGQCAGIPGADVPAVVVGPTASVSIQKPQDVVGSPQPVVRDSAAADSNTYVRFGSESWNSLVANADVSLSGGGTLTNIQANGSATTCDKASPYNWGEPLRPGIVGCYGYYPIVYIDGSVRINSNGRGQGILLVNGDLKINGNFQFYGLVVVRDDIDMGNGTAQVHGAIYAANSLIDDPLNNINGNLTVQYSKCAVESVLAGSAILVRAKERHWVQVQ